MGRVNKSGPRTERRRKASPGKKKAGKAKVVDRSAKSIMRLGNRTGRVRGRAFPIEPAPERRVVRILELDPFERCGRGTSVQRLIRVDEMVDRERSAHLVFFDRHGWYCEHGRTCPAVGHARKHAENGARSR